VPAIGDDEPRPDLAMVAPGSEPPRRDQREAHAPAATVADLHPIYRAFGLRVEPRSSPSP
jgi:hypothetical protein